MLGAETDTNDAGGQSAEQRETISQPNEPGWIERRGAGEDLLEKVFVDVNLHLLREVSGAFAPILHGLKIFVGDAIGAQLFRKQIGGRHGVLDGEIDTYATDRRHRMGGIANAEKPLAIPLLQVIDFYGEQLHIVPILDLVDPVADERRALNDLVAESFEALFAAFSE